MDQKRFCAMACACVCTVGGEGRMKGFMRRFTSTGQASIFAYRLGIQSAVSPARDIVMSKRIIIATIGVTPFIICNGTRLYIYLDHNVCYGQL